MKTSELRKYIAETKKPYQGVPCSTFKTDHTLDLLNMMEVLVNKIEELESKQTAYNFFLLPFNFFNRKVN